MISEKRLITMLQERFDEKMGASAMGHDLAENWSVGYADCYSDVMACVEVLAEERRIRDSARRSVKRLLSER